MSSLPIAGPCSVCGNHARKKCSVCYKLYCSSGCQRQDWKQHKPVCKPKHKAVLQPTDDDIKRVYRKATTKLSLFESQIKKYLLGIDDPPQILFSTHPDLQRVMSTNWMSGMAAWEEKANEELMQHIANADFKFKVNRIGGVQTVLMLNGKRTRVELYLPEPTRARAWTILMEPLATSPDEQF